MATTRLYPGYDYRALYWTNWAGSWDYTYNHAKKSGMSTSKVYNDGGNLQHEESATLGWKTATSGFLYGPFASPTIISGPLKFNMGLHADDNATIHLVYNLMHLAIVQIPGDWEALTVHETLLDMWADPDPLQNVTDTSEAGGAGYYKEVTISSGSASTGDYLLLEVGFRDDDATTTTHGQTIYQHSGSDAPAQMNWNHGVYTGWIELDMSEGGIAASETVTVTDTGQITRSSDVIPEKGKHIWLVDTDGQERRVLRNKR